MLCAKPIYLNRIRDYLLGVLRKPQSRSMMRWQSRIETMACVCVVRGGAIVWEWADSFGVSPRAYM